MGSPILGQHGMHPKHFSPPFTLKYIQSLAVKKGNFLVKLVDCLVTPLALERTVNDVLAWNAEVVVISSSTHNSESAMQLCSLVKAKTNIFAVAIGQGPTSYPFDYCSLASSFDVVLRGEAEREVISLLEALRNGKSEKEIKGEYVHRLNRNEVNLVWDLDALPFPEYSTKEIDAYQYLYPIRTWKKLRWGHILSSRGCPHNCIFCSQIIRETYGNKVRLRSHVNVVDEIESLLSKGVNIIAFDDDNFTALSRHAMGICREIVRRKLKVKWIAHARVDELNVSLLLLMKKAGCVLLRFGVESGSERIVKILRKTYNSSWTKVSKDIFNLCRKIGIATNALFMIGNPTETEEEINATIQLAQLLKPHLIQVHFFTPYPDLSIHELLPKNTMKKNEFSQMHHYAFPRINSSKIDSYVLVRIRSRFYRKFLLRPYFLMEHFLRYFPFYISNTNNLYLLVKVFKLVFLNYRCSFSMRHVVVPGNR